MSTTRAKACIPCRRAKARCSLQTPCSRCSTRCLQCEYARRATRDSKDEFREIRPSVKSPQRQDQKRFSVEPLRSTDRSGGSTSVEDGSFAVPGAVISSEEQVQDAPRPHHVEQTSSFDADQATSFVSSGIRSIEASTGTWTSNSNRSSQRSHDHYTPEPIGDPLTLDPSKISFRNVSHAPQLMQRGRSLQQGSLTAKMILGRLTGYILAMVDVSQLPPFIHPPCSFQSGRSCSSLTAHDCIPPILHLCVCHMRDIYYSRNAVVTWEQISDHLQLLRSECRSYDEGTLLQAMQAVVLYGLLCSQVSTPVSSQYSGLVVTCIESIGKRLFSMVLWTLDTIITSREQWILVESIRRMACMLYLIDLLLLSDIDTPSRGNCETFWDMPLPCHRELWHATTDEEWRAHYESTRKNSLTLGRLLLLRQSKRLDEVVAKAGGSATAQELAEWCERADDLSMLLWMALSIEGEGQSNGNDVGGRS